MIHATTVFLLFTSAPAGGLSEASVHNQAAMRHVERGDLEAAYAEFSAAYAALPDAEADREAREGVMGSLRSVLLKLYAADRADPEPLCRLQARLRAHIDGLSAAYPDQPELLELRGNTERLAAVTRDLEPFGAGACVASPAENSGARPLGEASGSAVSEEGRSPEINKIPSPAVPSGSTGSEERRSPSIATVPAGPTPRSGDAIPPRHLKIAGGVILGLAGVGVGIMAWRIADEASLRRESEAIGAGAANRPFDPDEYEALTALRREARASRIQAIGVGAAAAGLTAVGVGLVVAGHRAARSARWSANPWWLPGGGGLTFRIQLGAPARARSSAQGAP